MNPSHLFSGSRPAVGSGTHRPWRREALRIALALLAVVVVAVALLTQ